MEKGAGLALAASSLVAAACFVLFQPAALFVLGSLLAGVAAYSCWRAVLADKHQLGAVVAIAAVLLFLVAAVPEFARPLPVLAVMGFSHFAVGLYAALLLKRVTRKGGA
jgi:hypothetical protein